MREKRGERVEMMAAIRLAVDLFEKGRVRALMR